MIIGHPISALIHPIMIRPVNLTNPSRRATDQNTKPPKLTWKNSMRTAHQMQLLIGMREIQAGRATTFEADNLWALGTDGRAQCQT
jgi:hypothetical protein